MRWTIVAVDAIHTFGLQLSKAGRGCVPTLSGIFGHLAVHVFKTDVGNVLALGIGPVGDLVADIHVPVNPRNHTSARIATTGFDK